MTGARLVQYLLLIGILSLGYYAFFDSARLLHSDEARQAGGFVAALLTVWLLDRYLRAQPEQEPKPPARCLEDVERDLARRPALRWPTAKETGAEKQPE